jgi:hypothetical protein
LKNEPLEIMGINNKKPAAASLYVILNQCPIEEFLLNSCCVFRQNPGKSNPSQLSFL